FRPVTSPSRRLLVGAAFIMGAGLVATSLVTSLWMGYLTYGVGVGFGAGLYITPGFAVVGGWFDRDRALALGVASAGSGLGTLLLVPVASALIESFGWRTTYVILGAVAFVVLLGASFLVAPPPVPTEPAAGPGPGSATASGPFRLLFMSNVLMSLALFAAFAFVVPFATDEGISSRSASLLISIVGAASLTGRLALSSLVRRLGPLRLYQACLCVQPVAYLVWLVAGGSYGLLAVFAVMLGLSYGGYVALAPTVAAHLFGVAGLGGLLGTLFFGSALGGLFGPPVAGFLADRSGGHALPIALSLVVTVGACLLTLAVPDRTVPEAGALEAASAPPAPVSARASGRLSGDGPAASLAHRRRGA
ncbi:MAG: MFS transporter, partial [Acidimicrobiia bacterium]|nr:MFS transporter [Acidimicrobiia bacterium]